MICRCKWVKVNNEEFKISSGVIVGVKHDLPIVGVICQINIINGDTVIFSVDHYDTSFEPHYRAYILDETSFCSANIFHSNLFIQNSVHIRTSHVYELSGPFVILPFSLCVTV